MCLGRNIVFVLLGAALLTVAASLISISGIGERAEYRLADLWFSIKGKEPPPSKVMVVALDELSYTNLSVPLSAAWPRALHAELISKLAELGAEKVVFDVLFLDQGADSEADAAFESSLKKVPVILGAESSTRQVSGGGGSFFIEELLEPYAPFRKAAAGIGLVSLPDDGGIIRRFMTARTEQTMNVPTLAEAGAGVDISDLSRLPREQDMIWYYGPARTIPVVSYYQVLDRDRPISKSLVEGRTVYVGLLMRSDTGPAQKDVFQTPYGGGGIFGVEVHATASANLRSNNWLSRPSSTMELLRSGIILFVLATVIGLLNPVWGGVVLGVSVIGWFAISYISFLSGYFLSGVIPIGVALPIWYLGATLISYVRVKRTEQRMRSAFEFYLSPEMAKQLGESGGITTLGGEKLWATALFTDIAGFTSITEDMPAERVAEMLNAYFSDVMDVVFHNNGTLIKFIGDAAFCLWGAPIKVQNHAELAVKTALAIQRGVEKFNSSGKFPPLHTRVGVNTGPMVVGNLGSSRRFDYTAIGDSVNLASRVEGLNKYFGTSVLITESCKKELGNIIPLLFIGSVRAAGKREGVNLYAVWETPPSRAICNDFERAVEIFRRRDFAGALQEFEKVGVSEARLKVAAGLYMELSRRFISEPPDSEWMGEVVFDSK